MNFEEEMEEAWLKFTDERPYHGIRGSLQAFAIGDDRVEELLKVIWQCGYVARKKTEVGE